MSNPTGRMENIKQLIQSIIIAAEPAAHVILDTSLSTSQAKMPLASVRIGPVITQDYVYGRLSPEAGEYEIVNFTIHCFSSNCSISGASPAKWATVFADEIIDYMRKNRTAYRITNEIHDIFDITSRESVPAQQRNFFIYRVIIEGKMLVKRKDSG